MSTEPKTAFISGHIAPPRKYFSTYYEPRLLSAVASGDSFVLGPAPGIDTVALKFLIAQGVKPSKITIYLAEFEGRTLRPALKWFEELGGNVEVEGYTTGDRDAAMTRDSDYDILKYMTTGEQKQCYGEDYYPRVSATEKNERRRKGLPLHTNHAMKSDKPQRREKHSWFSKLMQKMHIVGEGMGRPVSDPSKGRRSSGRISDRCHAVR